MLSLLFALPLIFGLLALSLRNRLCSRLALLGTAGLYLGAAIAWWMGQDLAIPSAWLSGYAAVDPLGLFFFTVMTAVFCGSTVYSLAYFQEHRLSPRREATYAAVMLFFVTAMTGVLFARHLALLWVFVEATTLASALLIYFEQTKSSLEATWKYIFICSIGISLAFVGIIILSMGSKSIGSLFFTDLYQRAGDINPFWLRLAFAFIFVGFGTKIGVAPIHAWLPDAHSEAPSPVSALLSGALLNATFLGLVRVYEIMIRAHLEDFANFLLLFTGFLSLLISAAFMLQIVNYKRMLAYSSIENMGILSLGLSLGRPGMYVVVVQAVAHSLAKGALFLTSGNILHLYGSKQVADVRGLLEKDPRTGWLWLISFLAIAGLPPFPSFLGKFLLIQAFFANGTGWLAAPFFLLILVIVFGMGRIFFAMAFGEPKIQTGPANSLSFFAYVPQCLLLVLLLAIGIHIPAPVQALMQGAAGLLR